MLLPKGKAAYFHIVPFSPHFDYLKTNEPIHFLAYPKHQLYHLQLTPC